MQVGDDQEFLIGPIQRASRIGDEGGAGNRDCVRSMILSSP
jgi:hypothetical protein